MDIKCKFDAMVKLSDLKQHPNNRNKHSKEQIERLAKILAYQGIRAPIIVSKRTNHIVKGHCTALAIGANKAKEAPVVYQEFESDEQEYAFLQSDNAIASWADLDFSEINNEITDLGPDFDIDLLGIKDFSLEPAEKFLEKDLRPDPAFKIIIAIESENDKKALLKLLKVKKATNFKYGKVLSLKWPEKK